MVDLASDILKLIDDFNRKERIAYFTSMRTVLRGNEGPIADEFIDSIVYGKYPYLNNEDYKNALIILEERNEIQYNKKENGKEYYKNTSDKNYFIDELDRLFGISNTNIESDDISYYTFYQKRDIDDFENSNIGKSLMYLIDNIVLIDYESPEEQKFLEYINKSNYIKSIIAQPGIDDESFYKGKKYTPDFLIETYHDQLVFVEVKPYNEISRKAVLDKLKHVENFFKDKENVHVCMVFRYDNKWHSLHTLKDFPLNLDLEVEVKKKLKSIGVFTDIDLNNLKEKIYINDIDIHKIIIENNFKRVKTYSKIEVTLEWSDFNK